MEFNRLATGLAAVVLMAPLHAQLPGAEHLPSLNGVNPVLVGSEEAKGVPMSKGTLVNEGGSNSDATKGAYVGLLTGGLFGSSVVIHYMTPGVDSDAVAPSGLKEITLAGYSPKELGAYGTMTLVRFEADRSNRKLKMNDNKLDSKHTKKVSDCAKLAQANGIWELKIVKPLEPGHYAILPLAGDGSLSVFWDFDVK